MAPSVKRPTLDFSSGHDVTVTFDFGSGQDLTVQEMEPHHQALRADRAEPAWDSLSAPALLTVCSLFLSLSLSLSK